MTVDDTKDICIVVIDYDDTSRSLIRKALIEKNYRVGTSKYGEAGLGLISQMYPDLIILELKLPGINGFEVLKKLSSNKFTKQIPVVILTEVTQKNAVMVALKSGAQEYFLKPFDLNKIFKKANVLISQYRSIQKQKDNPEESVILLRSFGVSLFELRTIPNKKTIAYFKKLLDSPFLKQSKNDNYIFDIRKIYTYENVLYKFFEIILKFFPKGRSRILAGKHYASLMELDIDLASQLYLNQEDLEMTLEITLPRPGIG